MLSILLLASTRTLNDSPNTYQQQRSSSSYYHYDNRIAADDRQQQQQQQPLFGSRQLLKLLKFDINGL